MQISNVEFGFLGGEEEWIKVQRFKECSPEISWFGKMLSDYKKKKGRTLRESEDHKVEMIACQEW